MSETEIRTRLGDLLRTWRARRGLSQLALSADAGISQKHLSFVESGRSAPSRDMVLRLSETLDIPLRSRNEMLLAAGFAPEYPERTLDDPELGPAMAAVRAVLDGHAPYPAIAVDRHWTLVAANVAMEPILASVPEDLLRPPVNVLKVSLHPRGLAPMIVNLAEWRAHIVERLNRQYRQSDDPAIRDLIDEIRSYPASGPARTTAAGLVAVPLRLRQGGRVLNFLSTTTVFGTAAEITLSELVIEAFFPADEETRAALAP